MRVAGFGAGGCIGWHRHVVNDAPLFVTLVSLPPSAETAGNASS